jgi:cupin fold WbuC family metalloprotein
VSGLLRLDEQLLAELLHQSRASPRRRAHHSLHPHLDFPAHRLLVGMQPDSYVRPHCHLAAEKDETLVVLRGALGVLRFSDGGTLLESERLVAGGACLGVDIGHGVWHSVIALAPDTVFFEAKAGPYRSVAAEEMAAWAPAEGEAACAEWLRRWGSLFEPGF